MLILLPASEAKQPVVTGRPVDLEALSFPQLRPTRDAVLDALVHVSALPDATKRLCEAPGRSDVVRHNTGLRDAPAALVGSVYGGVLYDAFAMAQMDAPARRRARSSVVVVSALWGAVRMGDRIPSYRLNMCGRLPGLAHLTDVWRAPLSGVLPTAVGRGVLVDFRSSEYFTAWRPTGELVERTALVRVVRDLLDGRGAGSHHAKRTRGLVARQIVMDAIDARRPQELAEALNVHFQVGLVRPQRPGATWIMNVVEST